MLRKLIGIFCWGYAGVIMALDSASIAVDTIRYADWVIQDVILTIKDINQPHQQFELIAGTLKLPAPLDDFRLAELNCTAFSWSKGQLVCRRGKGRIDSRYLQSPVFDFSVRIQDSQGTLQLSKLKIAGGTVQLSLSEKKGKWQFKANGRAISLSHVRNMLAAQLAFKIKGRSDIEMTATGNMTVLQSFTARSKLTRVNLQSENGRIASEGADVTTLFKGQNQKDQWTWSSKIFIGNGDIYVEPVFLNLTPENPITIESNGQWHKVSARLNVDHLAYRHGDFIQGDARAHFDCHLDCSVQSLSTEIQVADWTQSAPIYLSPFLEAEPLEGLSLKGRSTATVQFENNALRAASLVFGQLDAHDKEQRFQLYNANGEIYWQTHAHSRHSFINWQQFTVKSIPFGQGGLDFNTYARQLKVIHNTAMPVLGGNFMIDQFSFELKPDEEPDVVFAGAVNGISLEKLSAALGWVPLSGDLTGSIPGVTYQNNTLSLQGALTMQLFGGTVTFTQLASSGLFTDFSQFYADLTFTNLDLKAVTEKFQFGSIEGRLSGYAHDVYLENWRPVSFYAWLGTPEDDNSRRRISQKAVENIASIGGGGAADVVSRGFLRFFDTFRYDRLGFGCYLHNGVCQMMGVEPADNGFYLVKGGGLPRIDVIGYNPRLDWNVLMQRLRRITTSNQIVVE